MKSISYVSGITPATWSVAESDPLYWLLLDCYESVQFRHRLAAAGVEYTSVEATDISDAELLATGMSEDLAAWLVAATEASIAGEDIPAIQESYIPELIEFLSLAVTGQWGLIFVLFVKVGLKFLLERLKDRLDPDNDVDDTAQVLRDSLSALMVSVDSIGQGINDNYEYASTDAERSYF